MCLDHRYWAKGSSVSILENIENILGQVLISSRKSNHWKWRDQGGLPEGGRALCWLKEGQNGHRLKEGIKEPRMADRVEGTD